MRWSQATDIGWVRPVNEDSLCVCPDLGLFAVADGMGGRQAGEVASRLAIQELEHFLRSCADSQVDTGSVLGEGVQKTNKLVYRMSFKNGECRGMGTTLSCVVIRDNQLCLAHVGDSRILFITAGENYSINRRPFRSSENDKRKGPLRKKRPFTILTGMCLPGPLV